MAYASVVPFVPYTSLILGGSLTTKSKMRGYLMRSMQIVCTIVIDQLFSTSSMTFSSCSCVHLCFNLRAAAVVVSFDEDVRSTCSYIHVSVPHHVKAQCRRRYTTGISNSYSCFHLLFSGARISISSYSKGRRSQTVLITSLTGLQRVQCS